MRTEEYIMETCVQAFIKITDRPIAYRNRKLEISTAPTKVKSREPAYSQALVQTKIDRQRVRSRESGREGGRQSDGYGGWCLDRRGQIVIKRLLKC